MEEKIKELEMEGARISWDELTCVSYPVSEEATEKLCQDIEKFRKKAGMSEHSVKKEQLINWKILKQSEGQLLATNAYALLTSDYFSFSKTQCAVFKGTDRAVFLDKMKYGHRGANHPVKNLETGKVYISSQNHGYVVDADGIDASVAKPWFVNVNDGTIEGLEYIGKPVKTVQFHPEANAGPKDSEMLFDEFMKMIGGNK